MKKGKQWLALAVAFALVSGTLGSRPDITEAKPAWKKAYRNVVKQFEKQENFYTDSKLYQLVYVNDDKVPELVCSNGPMDSIYTFYNGKAVVLYEGGSGAGGDHGRYYIPKKNIMIDENADYAGALVGYYRFEMDGGSIKELATLFASAFKDSNGNKRLDSDEQNWENVRNDGKYTYY